MGGGSSKEFEIRVRVKGCGEGRVIGPSGDGHVEVVLDNGEKRTIPREHIEIISEDLSAGMRVKVMRDSSDGGKWYKSGELGEVVGRSKMGEERVEVKFDNTKKPQQPPRNRLDVLSPVRLPGQGMKTIVLIRHGRAEHNDDMSHQNNYPDAKLTELGRNQAKAWASNFLSFGEVMDKVELVLVSPLRRTIQTACHVFANRSTSMQLCMPAREMWWNSLANQPIIVNKPQEFEEFLNDFDSCPNGKEKFNVDTMIRAPQWEREARCQEESVQHLLFILTTHRANTLAVVTHHGVIKALTGEKVDNCAMVECVLFEHWQAPVLKCLQKHAAPLA